MVKLIIEDDEGKTTVVPLIRDEITIGRKEGNTIRLTERNVSRKHAKLLKQSATVFIEDLDSYNGIKVNGNKIAGRVAVAEGDRIQIGDYVLGLKLEGVEKPEKDLFESAPKSATNGPPVEAQTAQIDTNTIQPPSDAEPTTKATPHSKEPQIDKPSRLVCLSNNFPGQEWVLSKSVMVVGRTEDNDIVINHRSISRHHSRITEENGSYTIIDLQSSNGVRINGEEYGKVVLRRGDLIDLGHVRLRFVSADEDFVFSRDASIVDISKAGRSRGGLWAGIIVVALVAVGFLVWQFSKTDSRSGAVDSGVLATKDTKQSKRPVAVDPAKLVAQINQSVQSEQWDDVLKNCAKLTGETRTNAEANCKKAAEEKKALGIFEEARRLAVQNKHLEAVQKYNEIPSGSIYKSREQKQFSAAKAKFLTGARKQLDDEIAAKDCDRAKLTAATIKEIEPSDTDAADKAGGCNTAVAVVERPKPRVRPKKPRQPRPKQPKPKQPPATKQPNLGQIAKAGQLKAAAQNAYVNGAYPRAIKLCKQVIAIMPGHKGSIQIMGASYCMMKNKAKAKWAFDRLTTTLRNNLRKICLKQGITL